MPSNSNRQRFPNLPTSSRRLAGRWPEMAEFLMPALGADMTEGTVLEWLVRPGDTVRKGDVVAVVDTAKAAIEVECFTTGTVGELLVPVGTKVPVGTPLAMIDGTSPRTPSAKTPPPQGSPPAAGEPRPAAGGHSQPRRPGIPATIRLADPPARVFAAREGVDLTRLHGTGRDGRITHADVAHALAAPARTTTERARVSPYARRLAHELDVDLTMLAPETPGGAIHARHVRSAAGPATAPGHVPEQRRAQDPAAMRQAIAALMARAKREIPHYYLSSTIDLDPVMTWLREHNRRVPVTERILPAAALLKATALAAVRVPELNGHWVDGGFRPGDAVHLGVAVALRGGGLVAPAILDAAKLSLPETMAELRAVVARARSGSLRSADLTAGTLTVTNLGDNGAESVHGVIYPPQVALVGFGAITHRPWAVDGMLGIRPLVTATLAADHRASDGATGSRLLTTIATLLRHPEEL
ncbi:dihydrolipoamide acetyltransferase family protein [Amycolatopsis sp. NPDC059027]|uniref:dihydrolipoamide acetyltransferase family protein n=1 Tax=unclassified Amycolatopsis TaxID=2618356 RepID=UPI00366E1432